MEREQGSKEVAGELGDLGENGNSGKYAQHLDCFCPGSI